MDADKDPTLSKVDAQQSAGEKQGQNLIPSKYKGLPSELVAEVWQPQLTGNEAQNREMAEQRRLALESLRAYELKNAQQRGVELQNLLEHIPAEQKSEVPAAEKQAIQAIAGHLSGQSPLADLSNSESFVLAKLSETYQKAKQQNPDQPVTFQFSQTVDAVVFENLKKRLIFEQLKAQGLASDKQKLKNIRNGLETNETKKGLTETEVKEIEQIVFQDTLRRRRAGETYQEINQDLIELDFDLDFAPIGARFDAHGIAKLEQFAHLRSFLEKGIEGHLSTAPLTIDENSPHYGSSNGAYKSGRFILLSEYDGGLNGGKIKYVLVNDEFYTVIDKLAKAYPQVEFIRADQAKQRLKQIAESKK